MIIVNYGTAYIALNTIKFIINYNFVISWLYGLYSIHQLAKKIDKLPIKKTILCKIRRYFYI
jgi:hypothetical protein